MRDCKKGLLRKCEIFQQLHVPLPASHTRIYRSRITSGIGLRYVAAGAKSVVGSQSRRKQSARIYNVRIGAVVTVSASPCIYERKCADARPGLRIFIQNKPNGGRKDRACRNRARSSVIFRINYQLRIKHNRELICLGNDNGK